MTEQWTSDQLEAAYKARKYEQIDQARQSGELNVLMGGTAPHEPGAILTDDDVHHLYAERRYDEIDKARVEGRIASMTTNEGA